MNKQEEKVVAPPFSKTSVYLAEMRKETKKVTKTKPKKVKKKKQKKKKVVKKSQPKTEEKTVEKKVEKPQEEKKASVAPSQSTRSNTKAKEYKESYINSLRREIDKNKKYPIVSKRLKEEGKVILTFTVLSNGEFTKIKIKQTSGYKRLDKAGFKAVYKTKRYKPIPKEVNKEFLALTLPIEFIIN